MTSVVVDAFGALEVCRWLVPDPAIRPRILTGYFLPMVTHALAYGVVHVIDIIGAAPGRAAGAPEGPMLEAGGEPVAVAAWLPPGAPPMPANSADHLTALAGPWADRFARLDAGLEQQHATGHHHLPLLAVRPGHQNTGLGAALLAHHHCHLDQLGEPAALDAAAERSVPFYRRHGYAVADQPLVLPGGLSTMWPMRRAPQPRTGLPPTAAAARPGEEARP